MPAGGGHGRVLVLVVAGVALVLAVAGQGQLALALAVVCAASLFPSSCGVVVRGVLGLACTMTFFVVVATACDQLSVPLPPAWLAGVALLVSGAAAWAWGHRRIAARRGDRAVGALAALGGLLVLPKAFGGPADHVARLVYGYDNVHHVRYSFAMGQVHGYTYGHASVPGLYEATSYRPAQAFLTEYLPWMLRGGQGSPTFAQTVLFADVVYAAQVVAIAVAAALLLRELIDSVPAVGTSRRAWVAACAVLTVLVMVGLAPVIGQRGFQAQAFATASMLAGLLALAQLRRGVGVNTVLLASAACVALAMNSWPLAAGPLVAAVGFVFLRHVRAVRLVTYPMLAVLIAVAAYPIWGVPVFYSDTAWLSSQSPAVMNLPVTTWLPLTVLGLASLAWAATRARREVVVQQQGAALVGALGTLVAVPLVQALSGQRVGGYYVQKTVYALVLLLMVASVAGLSWWLARTSGLRRVLGAVTAGVLLFVAWAPLGSFAVQTYWRQPGATIYDGRPVAAALARFPDGAPSDLDMVVLGTCRPTASDYTTRWLGTILRSWSVDRNRYVGDIAVRGENLEALQVYASAQRGRTIEVYTHRGCPLGEQIAAAAIPNVRVVALTP